MKKSEYDLQAESFLARAEAKMDIVFICTVKGFPFDKSDRLFHNKYQIVITRDGKQYDFPFYGSNMDYKKNKKPSAYSVLACLEKYEQPSDVWEFATNYGYEINSKESYELVNRIYNECRFQYECLMDLFGEYYMDELREIV